MVAESTDELDIEAFFTKPTKFIREDKYLENLLDDLVKNDHLLDELQDDLAIVTTMGIIPLEFADQASDS